MNEKNHLTKSIHQASIGKRMLQGAVIPSILIILFLLKAGEPNPNWPKLWRLQPLIIVPFSGAMGGVFFYLMDFLRYQGGWKKVLAITLSVIVYIIGVWLGIVLGLNGTYWN